MPARELAISFGGHSYGLLGLSKFGLVSVSHEPASLAMFLFSVVFMDTAATIPTGAMAERWKFSAFFVYGFFMSMFLYPLYGNWVWGGGWLAQLGQNLGLGHGHVDFAGSSVVHMTGGIAALAGAIVLGPRIGKFRREGAIGLLPGHDLPFAMVGTLILAFGWFGFNTGSTLAASDPRVARYRGQHDAGVGGRRAREHVLSVASIPQARRGDGLQRIARRIGGNHGAVRVCDAGGGGVDRRDRRDFWWFGACSSWSGAFTSTIRLGQCRFMGYAGSGGCWRWGFSPTAVMATAGMEWPGPVRGLLYGDTGQFFAQVIGATANIVVVFGLAFGFFMVIEHLMGNRVPLEVEFTGLDALEMGSEAYPGT